MSKKCLAGGNPPAYVGYLTNNKNGIYEITM